MFDGACAIAVGDPGQIFTVDPAGTSPCTSLRSGSGTRAIDLRSQRCDGTVGAARWGSVALTDSASGELTAVTIAVRDAATGQILATGNLAGGGSIDISGIDPAAHPALIVDGSAAAASGTVPWDDGIPPRLVVRWSSDAQSLCVRTTAASCSPGNGSSLGLIARLASNGREAESRVALLGGLCAPVAGVSAPKATGPCSGRRSFRINVFYPGRKIRRIVVVANGVRQRVLRKNPKPRAEIDLKRKRKGEVMVLIRITKKSGGVVTSRRYYNPCTLKMKGRGFRF